MHLGKMMRKMIVMMIWTVILVMNTLDPSGASMTYDTSPESDDPDLYRHHHHHHHHGSSSWVPKLKMDTALLHVSSRIEKNVTLFTKSKECYSCPFLEVASFHGNHTLLVNTTFGTHLKVKVKINETNSDWQEICNLNNHFMEYGNYNYFVSLNTSVDSETYLCVLIRKNLPMDVNIPVYVAIAILIFLAISWIIFKYFVRKHYIYNILFCMETERLINNDLGSPGSNSLTPSGSENQIITADTKPVITMTRPKERLKSLDTFRGVSIVVMIFVNYGGGGYYFFKHSSWNGLTVADLVFPWFVFIMGTSMAFSFKRPLSYNTPKRKIFLGIVRRSVILFFLGICTNTGPKHNDLNYLRIPGVLQRFGVAYFVVATIYMFFARLQDNVYTKWWSPLRDVIHYWVEWIIHLVLLATYLGIMFGLEVPGCPTGYLGPGGLADEGKYFNCTGGASGYIDRLVFSENHIYHTPTSMHVYQTTMPYDPEGLLGCLTTIFICFLGLQAGKILVTYQCWKSRLLRLILWGIVTGVIGLILCKGTQNDGWIPINKNLWSVSFILCLAGMAFIFLGFCFFTIDVQKWWTGAPFFYSGMNSILLYLGHEILEKYFPISWKVPETHAAQLAMDLWGAAFWVIVSVYLHHKKIFLSI